MKTAGETRQVAFDKLLRSDIRRQNAPNTICAEFDADLANAYIERSLTKTEQSRYEGHLFACASCRKNVVTLTRMAAGNLAATQHAIPETRVREPLLRRLLGVMSTPQWAIAATAIIALTISLPLIVMSRRSAPSRAEFAINQEREARAAQAPSPASNNSSADSALQSQPAQPADHFDSEERARNDSNSRLAPPAAAAPASAPSGNEAGVRVAMDRKEEAQAKLADKQGETLRDQSSQNKIAAAELNDLKKRQANAESTERAAGAAADSTGAPAATQPQPVAAESANAKAKKDEPALDRIDPEKARRLPVDDKEAARVTALRPGRVDGTVPKGKEGTIRAADGVAPTDESFGVADTRSRSLAAPPATAKKGAAFREARAGERRGAPERKISNKRFWLHDNTWTDKEYDPGKEMPSVTIIHDSDVFKEVIAKKSGLKPYLTSFAENERAIIVFKGTVYKLIPQNGNQ
jgi:hypothetical protein